VSDFALTRFSPTYARAAHLILTFPGISMPLPSLLGRLAAWARLRAPEAKASATGPLIALHSMGQPVWSPRDYGSFAREGFMQNPIVHRSVRMIAEAVASVPLLLYSGSEEIERHPFLDLIARPNPNQCGPDLIEALTGFLLVSGNAYLEAVSVSGRVREIYALRPDRMKVVPGANGWPEAYEYTVGGQSVRFAQDVARGARPILHLAQFHPLDDHYGLSPVEAAATAIDIHNAASRWNKALLDNSARPSGALVYTGAGGRLTGEQFERLKRELETSYEGAANAGRPMLLEGGLDWKALSLSPRDMDFIELKHVAAREIALALGVPPMLLGIPGDNTYSNYQEASRAFWRSTVLPLVWRIAKALSGWLGEAFEGGRGAPLELRPDLDAIEALAGEREALWARIGAAEFLTRDEQRAAVGYERAGSGLRVKFNPYHDDLGRFTFGPGDDTGADSADPESPNLILVADDDKQRKYSVNLADEEARGGHTLRDHVGRTDEELLAEARRVRARIGPFTLGLQKGSFLTQESANDFVNRVLEDNKELVDAVASGKQTQLTLNKRFGYVTGKEAYRPSGMDDAAYIRPTYEVRVLIRHDSRIDRGYRVLTAFPRNQVRKDP
jgi:HK97 family phage portal protein